METAVGVFALFALTVGTLMLCVVFVAWIRRIQNNKNQAMEIELLEETMRNDSQEIDTLRQKIRILKEARAHANAASQQSVHHKALVVVTRELRQSQPSGTCVQFHGTNAVCIGKQYFTVDLDKDGNILNLWPAPTTNESSHSIC